MRVPTTKIKLMLSSTISDLKDEREHIAGTLEDTGLVEIIGMAPGSTPARGGSSFIETSDLAADCDLYILVLAGRYGYTTNLGKSATEIEYETAYRADPTKIIVLRKTSITRTDRLQREFIKRVEDYHHGYFTHRFSTPDEAGSAVRDAFLSWLRDRAALGRKLDYFDHFVRVACQRQPFPGSKAEYRVTADRIELRYTVLNKMRSVHYDKEALYDDFWGSVADLEKRFQDWRSK